MRRRLEVSSNSSNSASRGLVRRLVPSRGGVASAAAVAVHTAFGLWCPGDAGCGAVNGAVGGVMDGAMDGAMDGGSAVGGAVGGAIGGAISGAVGGAVGGAIGR